MTDAREFDFDDVGLNFQVEAQARFLNTLRSPFGSDSDKAQERVWQPSPERLSTPHGKGQVFRFDVREVDEKMREILQPARAVLDSLAVEPFLIARRLWWEDQTAFPELLNWRHLVTAEDFFRDLRDAMTEWANHWQLNAEWCLDIALQTLRLWIDDVSARNQRVWVFPAIDLVQFPDLVVKVRGWSPVSNETVAEFSNRARKEFAAVLKEYVHGTRQQAKALGWRAKPSRLDINAHIWTILSHVLRVPLTRIASDTDYHESTVRESVNGVVRTLGLRGKRPRGRKVGKRRRRSP